MATSLMCKKKTCMTTATWDYRNGYY